MREEEGGGERFRVANVRHAAKDNNKIDHILFNPLMENRFVS